MEGEEEEDHAAEGAVEGVELLVGGAEKDAEGGEAVFHD